MNDDPFDFASLETDLDSVETKQSTSQHAKTQQFPCERCGGSGVATWGYRTVQTGPCRACKGKGHFMTSPAERKKSREYMQQRKVKKGDEAWSSWAERNPELGELILANMSWNSFLASLYEKIRQHGDLTHGQHQAAIATMAKIADAQSKKQHLTSAETYDLAAIHDLFATAHGNGIKTPRINIDGLVISRAPDHGKNAGALYITIDGEYHGKITPEGQLRFAYTADKKKVEDALRGISGDPLEYAKAYGRRTGTCCLCNRELTNAESIDLGIGPICMENWGL